MGQQQLLLLVLGIVIVGLAVVVGIQAFGENQKKANSDAMVNDGVRIASDAQAWRLKPAAFGGGASNATATPFTGLTLAALGYSVNTAGVYTNLNGLWALSGTPGASFVVIGCSANTYGTGPNYNRVSITVTGTSPSNIATAATSPTTCTPGT